MKVKKVEFFVVDYGDFESFVKEIYGKDFCFVSQEEANNDSEYEFDVDGDVDKWSGEQVEKFKAGDIGTYGLPRALLNDMCKNGHIEPGAYLVKVCW